MNQVFLIDTDILIDVSREIAEAVSYLEDLEQDAGLAISVVTQMELIVGCRQKREFKSLERFLGRFHIITLNESISAKAVDLLRTYRLSHGILIPDALIAGTALHLNCPLVTKNRRDYRFIEGLSLPGYPPLQGG